VHKRIRQSSADVTDEKYPTPYTISELIFSNLSDWLQKKLAVPSDMK